MKNLRWLALLFLLTPFRSFAFCGFYVAKADSSLFNQASQVVLVHNENKTVISMMNDYKGNLKEFAMVIPVPVVLQKGQIHIGDRKLFDHLDAYTSPRLVEYFDPDPCQPNMMFEGGGVMQKSMTRMDAAAPSAARTQALGVKIEAQYTIGEYDIVLLSAKESTGLETWLAESGYKIPVGAHKALEPYIKQDMKFFVAKVNLKEQAKTGLSFLRPIQFAFESPKFMLPIRLGMINSAGSQDLVIYVLSKEGRVETTNYRTVRMPTGQEVPEYLKDNFHDFYRSMFENQVRKENMRAVFTEYFWNMNWCDPCAADPLSADELRQLGVFWLDEAGGPVTNVGRPQPWRMRVMPIAQPSQTMVTRLHVRYSRDTFPEDLVFQETRDQENFQGRYVMNHPWKGSEAQCPQAKPYLDEVKKRREREAQNVASLTGWDVNDVRKKMGVTEKPPVWWENLWK